MSYNVTAAIVIYIMAGILIMYQYVDDSIFEGIPLYAQIVAYILTVLLSPLIYIVGFFYNIFTFKKEKENDNTENRLGERSDEKNQPPGDAD